MVFIGGTRPLIDFITNLQFRVLHDLQHYLIGADFSFEGELAVYNSMVIPATLHDYFWSEIVGQAAVFNTTGQFPEQRVVAAL